MAIKKSDIINKNGQIIGAYFSVWSFLLTITFIVPILSMLPGAIFEKIAGGFVENEPYSNVARLATLLLSAVFLLILALCLLVIRSMAKNGETITKGNVVFIMALLYFFIHTLGFYVYWGIALHYRSDGQLSFSVLMTHPISSLFFYPIGLLIDFIKDRYLITSIE